jgi:biopolymer transport protein ExbB
MYTILIAAGWPVWPLLLTSIITLAILLERTWFLQAKRVSPAHLTEGAIQLADSGALNSPQTAEQAIQTLSEAAPLGRILGAALEQQSQGANEEKTIEAMQEAAEEVTLLLDRYMGALATIATIAPLLGLFGTVVGMIEIFGSQQSNSANPQQLAHGISIALYNTAFGLLIAIPAYTGWRALKAMAEKRQRECETAAKKLLRHLFKAA